MILEHLKDILPLLSKYAPSIAAALGFPGSGMILGILTKAFQAQPGNLPDLVNKILNDPDAGETLTDLECVHGEALKLLAKMPQPSKVSINVVIDWTTPIPIV